MACAGLFSLEVPRLGPFLSLVDFQRKFWLPRLVKLEPSIPVELPAAALYVFPVIFAVLPAFMTADRRVTVIVPSGALVTVAPASLVAVRIQRPSISTPFFIAQLSKSSG
jgi:hypothetical protein